MTKKSVDMNPLTPEKVPIIEPNEALVTRIRCECHRYPFSGKEGLISVGVTIALLMFVAKWSLV